MASWLGHSKIHFDAAERTLPIPLLSSTSKIAQADGDTSSSTDLTSDATNAQSLLDLCKQTTPPCRLNPLLFNGHLQTAWTAMKGTDIPITYKRKIFESKSTVYGDGGSFAVDFVVHTPSSAHHVHLKDDPTQELPPRTTYYTEEEFSSLGGDDSKPLLIMLHGLAGGSHEIYLRHVLKPLCLDAASDDERWEALVLNSRGCAHSKITSGVLYNARATWDVRQVVQWARQKWPKRKLFGIGFSLGANILTNVRESVFIHFSHSSQLQKMMKSQLLQFGFTMPAISLAIFPQKIVDRGNLKAQGHPFPSNLTFTIPLQSFHISSSIDSMSLYLFSRLKHQHVPPGTMILFQLLFGKAKNIVLLFRSSI